MSTVRSEIARVILVILLLAYKPGSIKAEPAGASVWSRKNQTANGISPGSRQLANMDSRLWRYSQSAKKVFRT